MFREIRTRETNLDNLKESKKRRGYLKIKPEKEYSMKEMEGMIKGIFKENGWKIESIKHF